MPKTETDCHCCTFGKAGLTTQIHYCATHRVAYEMLATLKQAEAAWTEYCRYAGPGALERVCAAFAKARAIIAEAEGRKEEKDAEKE